MQAEVIGKRVVVQHIPLGGLLEWESNSASDPEIQSGATQTHQYPNQVAVPWMHPRTQSSSESSMHRGHNLKLNASGRLS